MPPLALLAGGLGTRLGAITASVPKSLVTVAGEPFIAHQLRLLATRNIRDIVICCGHLGDRIESFVGNGHSFGCCVRYSWDGPCLLGTGGAIRRALSLLGEHFWVMYGDSYLDAPYAQILNAYRSSRKPGLMTVFANQNRFDTSNVQFVRGEILRYDKSEYRSTMQHIDYGLSLFSAEVFQQGNYDTALDLSVVQGSLAQCGALAGYEVPDRFYEIGSKSGLEETAAYLASPPASRMSSSALKAVHVGEVPA